MGAVPPIEFKKYFAETGNESNVGFLEHGELNDKMGYLNYENVEGLVKGFEKKVI